MSVRVRSMMSRYLFSLSAAVSIKQTPCYSDQRRRHSIPMVSASPVLDARPFRRHWLSESSHRHRRGDARMSLIIRDLEILESVIEDGFRFAFDDQLR